MQKLCLFAASLASLIPQRSPCHLEPGLDATQLTIFPPPLPQLLDRYPHGAPEPTRARWLSSVLGLQPQGDPADAAYQAPSLYVRGRHNHQLLSLPEIFEHLADSYTSHLAVQCSHLPAHQQDWVFERMERKVTPSGE